MGKGILVSLLGTTNIGKTTQANLLIRAISKFSKIKTSWKMKATKVKYPVYDILPSGKRINDYLRNKNPERLTSIQFQELNVMNKVQFQPQLLRLLNENDVVVAEMYTGTSIAYGMGDGIDKQTLIMINTGLLQPGLSILLDGQRFKESIEKGHIYEEDDEKTEKIRRAHLELAQDFGWYIVNANRTQDEVHDDIFEIVYGALMEL